MVKVSEGDVLRQVSNRHLWLANMDWAQLAEEGEPLIIEEGRGVRLTDSEGRSWIDVSAAFNSVNVGHGRAEIAEAAYRQMLKLPLSPPGTTTTPAVELAQKLAEITPGSLSRAFLVSGGSEANETALKIAKAYHSRRGEPGRYKVISRKGSYHGATAGVMWLGRKPALLRDFEPMTPGMVYAPQPNPYRCELGGETPSECAVRCAEAVEELILFHGPETVAAVIAEPVTTSIGAAVPGDEYWPMLRDICDRYGVLLIDDEVICGFGRTGKMFATEHWGVVPDIMTMAKGMCSSYLPIGAAVVREEIAGSFVGKDNTFKHIFTCSGHPVCAAAALKNIEIIEAEGMVQNAAEVGAYFKEQLEGLMVDHPIVGEVRGLGLLLAVELVKDRQTKEPFPEDAEIGKRLTAKMRDHGLLLNVAPGAVTFGPPPVHYTGRGERDHARGGPVPVGAGGRAGHRQDRVTQSQSTRRAQRFNVFLSLWAQCSLW